MEGGGEHGLHSMTLSPDGKRIYFNSGNHTDLPTRIDRSRPATAEEGDEQGVARAQGGLRALGAFLQVGKGSPRRRPREGHCLPTRTRGHRLRR
jgi:hypothetical protein